jgi:hypothetical protein
MAVGEKPELDYPVEECPDCGAWVVRARTTDKTEEKLFDIVSSDATYCLFPENPFADEGAPNPTEFARGDGNWLEHDCRTTLKAASVDSAYSSIWSFRGSHPIMLIKPDEDKPLARVLIADASETDLDYLEAYAYSILAVVRKAKEINAEVERGG